MIEKILLNVNRFLGRRPQYPRKRPYTRREVCISNDAASVTLAGELTLPDGDGPFPGAVLLTGSGQHIRDEPLAGHPWFLVLSDYLTRHGFAVLRCDDRGIGKSTGNFDEATLEDYAADAACMLRWLRAQDEVAVDRVGFIGHSEGGMTGPLATTLEPTDFVVMLAGPTLSLPDTLERQYGDILASQGKPVEEIEAAQRQAVEGTRILRDAVSLSEAKERMQAYLEAEGMSKKMVRMSVEFWARPWGLHQASYDPRPVLLAYEGPILALFGGTDLQVNAEFHTEAGQGLFANEHSLMETFPDRNHLFQPSATGKLSGYLTSKVTIDEAVMARIVEWVEQIPGALRI